MVVAIGGLALLQRPQPMTPAVNRNGPTLLAGPPEPGKPALG
jgi:hypothetical protein